MYLVVWPKCQGMVTLEVFFEKEREVTYKPLKLNLVDSIHENTFT